MFKNIFRNKKVLITGDTGFKGSWLALWLHSLGAQVYGYSLPPKSEKDNFVLVGLSSKINHFDGDVRNYKMLSGYFNTVQPDFAFHLAAQSLVIDSYVDPKYTFETNIIGAVNFLESVRNCPSVKVAINVTSDKCYRNNEWVWGYRENDAMGGKDPYSASKGASEIITESYLHSYFYKGNTANIASVRAGNVIGGGDWAENRIVPDFFRALEKNQPIKLRYPESTRPWQHVLEPLSGYLTLAMKLYTEGKQFSGGWNFGPIGTTNQTVRILIETMINYIGKGSYEVLNCSDMYHEAGLLNLDISKAMHLLKWKPILNFNETVKMTVDGYLLNNVTDVYEARLSQIMYYYELARKNNIEWAQ